MHILRALATEKAIFAAAAVASVWAVSPAAAAADATTPAPGAAVRGTVLDPERRPMRGARAALDIGDARWDALTDAFGRYEFRPATAGEGTLTFDAPGFPRVRVTVSVGEGDVELGAVVLERPSFSDEVVVVATGAETRLGDTAASVVALPREALWAAGQGAVDAALRQVPGFALFRRTGSRSANPTAQGVSLRGVGPSGASRALVLDDGIPMNDPFGGWVYWARVPRAALGRVEMLRGGGSDLYGSGALGGVVRLFRDPSDPPLALEASYGSQATPDISAASRVGSGDWSLASSAEAFRTDGYVAVDPAGRGTIDVPVASRHSTVDLAVEREWSGSRAFLRGAYYEEARENGTPFQRNGTRLRQLAAGLDTGALALRAYAQRGSFNQTFSAVAADRAAEQPTRQQQVPSSAAGVGALWSRGAAKGRPLAAGMELATVAGETDETVLATGSREAAGGRQWRGALFAGSAIGLGPRVRLTGGARLDGWRNQDGFRRSVETTTPLADRSETALSPRLSVVVRASDRVSAAVSAYRAFRAPTLNELYRSFRVGNVLTAANESLRAERMTGFEGGLLVDLGRKARLRANLFWMDLDRTVANVTLSVEPGLITRQRQNLGRAVSRGLEVDAEARVGRRWAVSAGYLLADATVKEFAADPSLEGRRLPQVPRHSASLQVRYDSAPVSIGAQARWTGDQFEDDLNTLALRGYWSLDAEARRSVGRAVEVFLAGENLTGARYDVGRTPVLTVGPPRSLRAGLRLRVGGVGRAAASAPPEGAAPARGRLGGPRPEPDEDGMAEQPLLRALPVADLAHHAGLDPGVAAAVRGVGAGGLVAPEPR
jgi:outer membrane receptor protein involved in Fe transport